MEQSWDPALYDAQHSFVWRAAAGLVEMLAPLKQERILDLGCGTGHLTAEIAQSCAYVVGIDPSPEMIGQARQNFPQMSFRLADAAEMTFDSEFDAVFSNAVLHWIPNLDPVAARISAALKPGGRLVAECGGTGNVSKIEAAIARYFTAVLGQAAPATRTVFRSIAGMAEILERHRLEVTFATLFDRPTRLEGVDGMARWLEQFCAHTFSELSTKDRKHAIEVIEDDLRPSLFVDGVWYADYRRLRFTARKL